MPASLLLIYHFHKNDDTADEMPYYLKRFLMKQFLNNCSTMHGEEEALVEAVWEGGFTYYL
jgi:hypothetical protein